MAVVNGAIYARSMRQFGAVLPESLRENSGIGPFLRYNATYTYVSLLSQKKWPVGSHCLP